MKPRATRKDGLEAAIAHYGSMVALAKQLGISAQAVAQWHEVPADRCVELHRDSGISLSVLRPDLYPPDLMKRDGKSRPRMSHAAA